MFTSWHASHRVNSSLSISRCTWRINTILSFVENRLRFESNGGALSASPFAGVGCAGGPSLPEVIWPADCAKNEVDETMKESTAGTYNYWASHSYWRDRTVARHSFGVWYQVCGMSSKVVSMQANLDPSFEVSKGS